jgi:hypothetical protein
MRIHITVHAESYDLESAQPAIDAARHALADYLEHAPRKSTRSKHGLMGPIGKILSEIKSGRRDPASLKGYAVRVHEAAGRTLQLAGMDALGRGIDAVVKLLGDAPVAFHDRILDRLDYGLYYDLRARQLESKEVRRQLWIAYLRTKYSDEEGLARAWDEAGIGFEELYLPRLSEGARSKKATNKQRDISEFWASQGVSGSAEEEEE